LVLGVLDSFNIARVNGTVHRSFEIILEWELPIDWNANPMLLSMQIHFFKKKKKIQSDMNYISENTYLQMTARAVTDESE